MLLILYNSKCFLAQAHPDCALGHLLKTLCRDDDFLNKLVNTYIMNTMEEFDLNCSAARVLLNVMPGLDSAGVFKVFVMVKLIYHSWLIELTDQTSYNIVEYWTFLAGKYPQPSFNMGKRSFGTSQILCCRWGEDGIFQSMFLFLYELFCCYHYLFIYSATITNSCIVNNVTR